MVFSSNMSKCQMLMLLPGVYVANFKAISRGIDIQLHIDLGMWNTVNLSYLKSSTLRKRFEMYWKSENTNCTSDFLPGMSVVFSQGNTRMFLGCCAVKIWWIKRSFNMMPMLFPKYKLLHKRGSPGPHLNTNTVFPGMWIPIIKIKRSWDHIIFIMGIPMLIKCDQNFVHTIITGICKSCEMVFGLRPHSN